MTKPAESYIPPSSGPPPGKKRYTAKSDFTQADGLAVLCGTLCDLDPEEGERARAAALVSERLDWPAGSLEATAESNRIAQSIRMAQTPRRSSVVLDISAPRYIPSAIPLPKAISMTTVSSLKVPKKPAKAARVKHGNRSRRTT